MKTRIPNPTTATFATALTPAEKTIVAELVADGLSIQDKFRSEPVYKQTGSGHFQSDVVNEIRQAKEEKGENL